jgi:hypothetical protein
MQTDTTESGTACTWAATTTETTTTATGCFSVAGAMDNGQIEKKETEKGKHRTRATTASPIIIATPTKLSKTTTATTNTKTTSVGTINIVTLTGKIEEAIDVMKERKLEILGMSETKWKGCGEKNLREGYKLCWSGGLEGRNGVAFLVSPKAKEYIVQVVNFSDRLIKMKLRYGKVDVEYMQVYAPQSGKPVEEKEQFVADLERNITSSEIIIMGDFNAWIGEDRRGYEKVMGAHGMGRRNIDGEKMLQMCARNSISIGNSWFEKRKSQKITRYGYGDEASETIIDYIVTELTLNSK